MALVDVSVRRGFIGGPLGRLIITLGRVSLEGWSADGDELVWFEGVRREASITEHGVEPFSRDILLDAFEKVAGFDSIERWGWTR